MTDASAPKSTERDSARRQLDVFAGTWRARGDSFGGPEQNPADSRANPALWTSEESYEWLPGGFFMLHKWDALINKHPFKGTEILGHDDAEGGFFTCMFDNAGNHPSYRASVSGHVWKFAESETRATVTFSSDGNRMVVSWEWRQGDSEWLPLCDRTANRVR